MNPDNKPRILYSISYTIPAVDQEQVKFDCIEELREALLEQLLEESGMAEANAVIARIRAM